MAEPGAPSDEELARMRSQWSGDAELKETSDEDLRRRIVVNRHLHRANAREDLISYAQYVMPWYRPAAIHREMANALMKVERGETDRLMITVPPRHGKTALSSILYPAWRMGRTPRMEIIAASYGAELAEGAIGRHLRNLMQGPEHREVFGEQAAIDPTAAAVGLWFTKAGGVYRAAGVGGGITGFGAQLLLIDDPVKGWKAAESPREQRTTYDWYVGDAYTRLMPDEAGRAQGAIVLVGTRWHERDLIGQLLVDEEKGEGDSWTKIYFPALPNPPWPQRYGKEFMERMKRVQPPRTWNALYMGNPTPEEGSYFKRDWMRRYDVVPEIGRMRIYGASDYAVRHGEGDYTVHIVVGVDQHDQIYILDFWREQAGPEEWVESLLDMAKNWKPLIWAEESGQMEKGIGPYLRRRMRERRVYFARQGFSSMADKPTRARAIQARMSMKFVHWPNNVGWWPEVLNEFMKFPLGTNDDVVDTMSLIGRMLDTMATGSGIERTLEDGVLSIGAGGGTVPEGTRPVLMGELSGRFSRKQGEELSERDISIGRNALDRLQSRFRRRRR